VFAFCVGLLLFLLSPILGLLALALVLFDSQIPQGGIFGGHDGNGTVVSGHYDEFP